MNHVYSILFIIFHYVVVNFRSVIGLVPVDLL